MNQALKSKYHITAWFYDILDYYWERQYRHWRPRLLQDVQGDVLEAGVGTGRNLKYYPLGVRVLGVDLSPAMLRRADMRAKKASVPVNLKCEDVTCMPAIPSNSFDWIVATFLCCVMPDELQPQALEEFRRVLKPGGRFCFLEIIFSKDSKIRKRQEKWSPFVKKVFGAQFDRRTRNHIENTPGLKITRTTFLKKDTHLLIEGIRQAENHV